MGFLTIVHLPELHVVSRHEKTPSRYLLMFSKGRFFL